MWFFFSNFMFWKSVIDIPLGSPDLRWTLCRAYGTLVLKINQHPALKRWAKLFRSTAWDSILRRATFTPSTAELIPLRRTRIVATSNVSTTMAYARDLHKLPRHRILWVGVIVESLPRLATVPARQHQPLQQWGRSEPTLLEFVVHDVGDVVGRVQSDEVQQGERTHRIATAQLHRFINVSDGADTLLVCANRIEQVRHQQAVHDKTCLVAGAHRHLAQLRAELDRRLVNLVSCGNGLRHFHQLHHRHRIEEVQSDEALGPLGRRHQFGDGD